MHLFGAPIIAQAWVTLVLLITRIPAAVGEKAAHTAFTGNVRVIQDTVKVALLRYRVCLDYSVQKTSADQYTSPWEKMTVLT